MTADQAQVPVVAPGTWAPLVQTPEQARVAAENQARAATEAAAQAAASEGAQVIVFPSDHEPSDREMPVVRALLLGHKRGEIEPEEVVLGPMPVSASKPMRDIAGDMQLRLGLLAAEGITRPLMYAASEAVAAGFVRHKASGSWALKRLCDEGVVRCVGEMAPLGKGRGTLLYVPPTWWPIDPEARAIVEATGQHPDAANLVWLPDDQGDLTGGAA